MDPNACLERYRAAADRREWEEVFLATIDLRGWVDDGGFEPNWTDEEREHIMFGSP